MCIRDRITEGHRKQKGTIYRAQVFTGRADRQMFGAYQDICGQSNEKRGLKLPPLPDGMIYGEIWECRKITITV